MAITILFENENCVVVDKPPGWLSVPGRTADDKRSVLGRELEKQLKISIFPIHRLDAEVSGIIIYGKTKDFHRDVNAAFEQHTIKKTYQAITALGPFEKGDSRIWKSMLVRGKKRTFEADYGKPATTEAVVHNKTKKCLDWRLNPITGRPHQLRVELKKHNCAILGDSLYGSDIPWPSGGIALRSIQIQLPLDLIKKWELPPLFEATPFILDEALL
ncbi:MAG: RNA pseudouridine synthase [Bdellovibrionaceae bacterium]|nr:RNA pseudouridine synthase [Pseudobdellovibrionaceae bacterium]